LRVVGYQNNFFKQFGVNIIYAIQESDPTDLQEGFLRAVITGGQTAGQDHSGAGNFKKTKRKAQIIALQAVTFQLKKKVGQNQGKIRGF
jgi:hypothetical protein